MFNFTIMKLKWFDSDVLHPETKKKIKTYEKMLGELEKNENQGLIIKTQTDLVKEDIKNEKATLKKQQSELNNVESKKKKAENLEMPEKK